MPVVPGEPQADQTQESPKEKGPGLSGFAQASPIVFPSKPADPPGPGIEGFTKASTAKKEALDSWIQNREWGLNLNVEQAKEIATDLAGRVVRAQAATGGLDEEIVMANLPDIEATIRQPGYDVKLLRTSSKKLRQWIGKSPSYAAYIREDHQALYDLDRYLNLPRSQWPLLETQKESSIKGMAAALFKRQIGLSPASARYKTIQELEAQARDQINFEENFIAGKDSVGFGESFERISKQNPYWWAPFLSGGEDVANALDVFEAARKIDQGQGDEYDEKMILRLARMDEAASRRGSGIASTIANVVASTPAFAGELAITGGIYRGIKIGTGLAIKAATEGIISGAMRKVLRQTVGWAAGSVAQTLFSPQRVASYAVQEMTPQYRAALSDGGTIIPVKTAEGKSFSVAVTKGFLDTFAEIASERTGAVFAKADDKLSSILFGWFQSKKPGATYQAFKAFARRAGVNGILGEMGEEQIGALMKAGFMLEPYQLPSATDLAGQAIGFSFMPAGGAVLSRFNREEGPPIHAMETPSVQMDKLIALAHGLKNLDPKTSSAIVSDLAAESSHETIFIERSTWNNYWVNRTPDAGGSADPAQKAAQTVGDNGDAYRESEATGLLAIPTAKFISASNPKDVNNLVLADADRTFFQEELKFDPGGLNSREIEEITKEIEKAAGPSKQPTKEAREEKIARESSQAEVQKELQTVFAGIKGVTKQQGKRNAELAARVVSRLAERVGVSPAEFYKQRFPQIVQAAGISGDVIAQAAKKLNEGDRVFIPSTEGEKEAFVEAVQGTQVRVRTADGNEAFTFERKEIKAARESVKERLFQGPRGFFDRAKNMIAMLDGADPSTWFHELAHFYFDQLGDIAAQKEASEQAKAEWAAVLEWVGAKEGEDLTKAQHEKLAKGFEKYLMEGVAPSPKLRAAFFQLKHWMLDAYRNIRDYFEGVDITPKVRRVFDRMLASEEEIAAAEAEQNAQPLFDEAKRAGMSDANARRYAKIASAAQQKSEEIAAKAFLEEIRREQTAEWKAERAEILKQVNTELDQKPEYRALHYLKTGTLPNNPDGTPSHGVDAYKMSRAEVRLYKNGEEYLDMIPRYAFTTSEEGISPDVMAEMFKFRNGADFLDSLAFVEPREAAANRIADERMRQIHGEPMSAEEQAAVAMQAIHNMDRAELYHMEMEIIRDESLSAFKDLTQAAVGFLRVPDIKEIRRQARELVEKKSLTEQRLGRFQAGEKKARKEALDLLFKGDRQGAFAAARRALLSHELYQATLEAQDEADAFLKKVKTLNRTDDKLAKSRDMNLVAAARAILAAYGLGNKGEKAEAYLSQIKQYDPGRYEALKAMSEGVEAQAGNYKTVPFSKFREMAELVESLLTLSIRDRQIEVDGKKVELSQARLELSQKIDVLRQERKPGPMQTRTQFEGFKVNLAATGAALRRVESWVDQMDNGNHDGPFHRYIWNPISDAAIAFAEDERQYYKKLIEALKPLEKTLTSEKISAPELGPEGFIFQGKGQLLMTLLHSGNESSFSKLLRGWGWGGYNEQGLLDTSAWDSFMGRMWSEGILTKEDYDAVQEIWNICEELKPGAQKAYRDVFGRYFPEIQARPISTPFGPYRGGYFPAKPDPAMNKEAAARADKQLLEGNDFAYNFPTPGSGFTKMRDEKYARPLLLDVRLIQSHVRDVLLFTHLKPASSDVSRLLMSDKGFREELESYDDSVVSEFLIPWLWRSAQQKVERPSGSGNAWKVLDTGARWLTNGAARQLMFGNFINALQQFTGLSVAAVKVSPGHLAGAARIYLENPTRVANEITEKSVFMRSATTNQMAEARSELTELLLNPNAYQKAEAWFARNAYILQTFTQNQVDLITWLGAYNEALEIHKDIDEAQAVRIANSAVRLTQGSFAPQDVSRIETGTTVWRSFMRFGGYFNTLANLNKTEGTKAVRELGLKHGAGRIGYTYLMSIAIPSAISAAIVVAAKGGGDPDHPEVTALEEWLYRSMGEQWRTVTAFTTPVGSKTLQNLIPLADSKYNDRIFDSPGLKMFEEIVDLPSRLGKRFYEGEDWRRKDIKDTLTVLGMISGQPIGLFSKPAGYLYDRAAGKTPPGGVVETTRGLVTGYSR